jgi:peptide-methionine (S)-S-oxide reductase
MNVMRSKLKYLKHVLFALVGVLSVAALFVTPGSSAEEARVVPAPLLDETAVHNGSETAVLAGGCFWGVQGVFQHVTGVSNAVSGYTGGDAATAHYRVVGTGRTGHADSVRITFDPGKVTYGHLLQIYFSVAHDPTQLNRQGPDRGTQYRSTIFPMTPEQAKIASAYIDQINRAHVFPKPIVTTVETGKTFYPAEGYHQNFLALNPTYPYIVINDLPKIANLKRLFPKDYRVEPVLVAVAKPSN